jgi:1-acyl-sn-glycerol-3-phosphate acyltransferase
MSASPARDAAAPRISKPLLSWFSRYARGYCRRHLHAVRLARDPRPPDPGERPLIVVMNHPSWWDPLIGLVLADARFAAREHFAPIDAEALSKYAFFARIGLYPVERGSTRGAASFLRISRAILARPRATLWMTAQGRFADPRLRPPGLQPGVGRLAHRLDDAWILPLAVELTFWEERTPEALLRFGDPVRIERGGERSPEGWTTLVEQRLTAAQDALAELALRRDAAAFETILGGRSGVGGVYDVWRRFRARLRGERLDTSHGGKAP